ncbi:MAG: PA2169 family four-helix-bundle protein [Bacteroidota bacterium]|nr:PA2169 family four-helix-bundle protein [Bacteroidota bacterium]
MEKNEKIAEILNDLIEINNDRVDGYEKAGKETASEDADLRSLFTEMANESRDYAAELRQLVYNTGENPAEGTTARGKIYRVWMDVKAAITGKSRKAILASCEFGEDAAQRAYDAALEESELAGEERKLVTEQKTKLKKAHDKMKRMRDTQEA